MGAHPYDRRHGEVLLDQSIDRGAETQLVDRRATCSAADAEAAIKNTIRDIRRITDPHRQRRPIRLVARPIQPAGAQLATHLSTAEPPD